MSWGLGLWGIGTWGLPAGPTPTLTMTVEFAYAISTHEVLVRLTKAPQDVSKILVGDVRNPTSWKVEDLSASPAVEMEIARITEAEPPYDWIVRTMGRLPDSLQQVRVSATLLLDSGGAPVGSPSSATMAGVTERAVSTPQALADSRSRSGQDLANVPAPSIEGTSLGGTLSVVGGDYSLVAGAALVEKLIVRRLTTTPNEFFHLPKYGVGLRIKQPLPAGSLVKLKAKIERQLLLEPDIAAVVVQLSQSMNTLTAQVRATMARTGQQVTVALTSPIGQG